MTTSVIGQRLDDYVTLRRSLGFKFDETSRLLAGLVGYLDEIGSTTVTTEVLLAWTSRSAGSRGPDAAGRLLSAARGFARYLASFDPATEVPPARLLPARSRRAIPFIYSKAEIDALMAATSAIESKLLAASYRTLVGLLAATGIRVGEAVGLDRDDVDTDDEALLVVRDGKFGKSRQVPLHPSTTTALRDYAEVRDRYCRRPRSTAWFLSSAGTRLRRSNIWRNFNKLREIAGLQRRSATCRPRIHDLRHTFAVSTLLRWYQAGEDVHALLPLLSTYLGHVNPRHTYWYLSATPELMHLVAERLPRIGSVVE